MFIITSSSLGISLLKEERREEDVISNGSSSKQNKYNTQLRGFKQNGNLFNFKAKISSIIIYQNDISQCC